MHLTLPQKIVLPKEEPRDAWLVIAEPEAMPYAPKHPRIDTLHPERGRYLSLAFTSDWPGRRLSSHCWMSLSSSPVSGGN